MAHYALLSGDNIVKTVIVVADSFDATEADGVAWCASFAQRADISVASAPGDYWRKTSYNGTIRKNFAGIGHTYDAGRDAFIAPKPGDEYILDEDTCRWVLPG